MHKSVACSFYTAQGQRLVGEWRNSVSADRPLEYQAMEILAILPNRFWGVCGPYAQAIHWRSKG
ncbi:MAG: hypothetical protein GC136_07415 [Alphaproteobacteria bacterium]|nr:hypothetical protein [Alphaproteobacteria bacterium]